jgi:hypothetical protein
MSLSAAHLPVVRLPEARRLLEALAEIERSPPPPEGRGQP